MDVHSIYIYLLNSEVDSSHACDINMQSNPLQVYSNLVILDDFSALRPLCSIHMSARGQGKAISLSKGDGGNYELQSRYRAIFRAS